MLERMWSKGNSYSLLVGMQTLKTTLEISMAVSKKIGNKPTPGSSNTTLGYIPKRCSIILQKHLFNCVTAALIARTWKQPRCPSTEEWIKTIWHIYTLEYYSTVKTKQNKTKQWHLEICIKMDGTRKHYPEWGNPDPNRWIWCELIHKWIWAINKGYWAYSSWS